MKSKSEPIVIEDHTFQSLKEACVFYERDYQLVQTRIHRLGWTVEEAVQTPPRRGTHVWAKGESGNPAGRPKGSKNKVTLLREAVLADCQEQLLEHFPSIVEKTIELAEKGDPTCLKLLWDRTVPARKSLSPEGGSPGPITIVVREVSPVSEPIDGAEYHNVTV